MIEIRPIKNQQELEEMFYQRWLVLRKPLGMERLSEKDEFDDSDSAVHLVAVFHNKIIGSARLRQVSPEVGSISYVAVLPEFQNQGIGTKLMNKLIEIAQKKNIQAVKLRARINALNFYKRLGFREEGELHDYRGIPHIFMYRKLANR
ncbi:MAG: GNAT family N-acetyltransferase [Nostocaceae cyanobacterium]|nr:GNAT family N-acetyltransferase [Nostocaceae cyanobacterium]